ncbi:hypothetical protein HCC61_14765 [Streptomyces sp. HNM0575]|uniref:hypothetical protein n=1 Tax=Streptomyces sp. HNM0575 TaxID=2716338 RepID=UPI00145E52BE|nr:hypothetical protein [Streptomyces sp. HNM0575]NLU73926.1 hypothetical protein [Streptomyces sp. HNM0575]
METRPSRRIRRGVVAAFTAALLAGAGVFGWTAAGGEASSEGGLLPRAELEPSGVNGEAVAETCGEFGEDAGVTDPKTARNRIKENSFEDSHACTEYQGEEYAPENFANQRPVDAVLEDCRTGRAVCEFTPTREPETFTERFKLGTRKENCTDGVSEEKISKKIVVGTKDSTGHTWGKTERSEWSLAPDISVTGPDGAGGGGSLFGVGASTERKDEHTTVTEKSYSREDLEESVIRLKPGTAGSFSLKQQLVEQVGTLRAFYVMNDDDTPFGVVQRVDDYSAVGPTDAGRIREKAEPVDCG